MFLIDKPYVSDFLIDTRWYSTQTTAYSLLAISKYFKNSKDSGLMEVQYSLGDGVTQNATSDNIIKQIELPIDEMKQSKFSIKNTGDQKLYIKFIQSGQPKVGTDNNENRSQNA